MDAMSFVVVQCPYCGEQIELSVDGSVGSQAYIEDCSVCCRPIEVRVTAAGGGCQVEVARDDE